MGVGEGREAGVPVGASQWTLILMKRRRRESQIQILLVQECNQFLGNSQALNHEKIARLIYEF